MRKIVQSINRDDLAFVEKYRPRILKDVIGQRNIVLRLSEFINDPQMPHLLLAGPAGTGKTTSALCLVHEIQGTLCERNRSYIELNASDARGIDVVRSDIKEFARMEPPPGLPFKIAVLDEADNMTGPAQNAFRRTMEKYSSITRFILICNYPNNIIDPIQSRCSLIRFTALTDDDIRERLNYIAKKENISLTETGATAILYVSNGDCRRAINYLQSCSNMNEEITDDTVYQIAGRLNPRDVRDFISVAVSDDIQEAKKRLLFFLNEYGISGKNIVKQMHRESFDLEMPLSTKRHLIRLLGETEHRLTQGATEDVQLLNLIMQLSMLHD